MDDGATKINAVAASEAHTIMLRTDRDAHMELIRVAFPPYYTVVWIVRVK